MKAKRATFFRSLRSASRKLTIASVESRGESPIGNLLLRSGIQRIPNAKVQIFQLRNFVPQELRKRLIELIEAERRPSTIADDMGDKYFRTSETCDLSSEEPAVIEFERLLFELNGIDPKFGEPLQGQRYDVGQEFKPHSDWFNPGGHDYEKYCSVAGQRTWTFMVYLNDVEAGGGTRFKVLKKTFRPEAGKLLCWSNLKLDGNVNPSTLHHGMKVRKGLKYVLTKWYREKEWG